MCLIERLIASKFCEIYFVPALSSYAYSICMCIFFTSVFFSFFLFFIFFFEEGGGAHRTQNLQPSTAASEAWAASSRCNIPTFLSYSDSEGGT